MESGHAGGILFLTDVFFRNDPGKQDRPIRAA